MVALHHAANVAPRNRDFGRPRHPQHGVFARRDRDVRNDLPKEQPAIAPHPPPPPPPPSVRPSTFTIVEATVRAQRPPPPLPPPPPPPTRPPPPRRLPCSDHPQPPVDPPHANPPEAPRTPLPQSQPRIVLPDAKAQPPPTDRVRSPVRCGADHPPLHPAVPPLIAEHNHEPNRLVRRARRSDPSDRTRYSSAASRRCSGVDRCGSCPFRRAPAPPRRPFDRDRPRPRRARRAARRRAARSHRRCRAGDEDDDREDAPMTRFVLSPIAVFETK